jgi:hypothetical protein
MADVTVTCVSRPDMGKIRNALIITREPMEIAIHDDFTGNAVWSANLLSPELRSLLENELGCDLSPVYRMEGTQWEV